MADEKDFVFHKAAKIQKCIFVVRFLLLKMDFISHYDSPLGGMSMASDGTYLVGLWFDGQKHYGDTLEKKYKECDLPIFDHTRRWLELYFSGKDPDFTPALFMRGTGFRRRVWEILITIPYGQTMTYGEIAKGIGKPGAAQAIGNAVSHNPISLIVPCHRVLGADGSLTGYAGGMEKKRWLLERERDSRKLSKR